MPVKSYRCVQPSVGISPVPSVSIRDCVAIDSSRIMPRGPLRNHVRNLHRTTEACTAPVNRL